MNEKSRYVRCAKVMIDAKHMMTEKKNFTHIDEIREKYLESKERADAAFALKKEEIEALEAQRKADLEKRKQERLAKKEKGGKNND